MSILKKLGTLFSDKTESAAPSQQASVEEHHLAAAALMVEVAVHDGSYSADEESHIKSLLINKLELSEQDARELLQAAKVEQENSNQILGYTRKIKDHFDEEGRAQIMEMLWQVVFADGREDDFESNLMRRVAGLLYVSDRKSGEIRKKVMAQRQESQ